MFLVICENVFAIDFFQMKSMCSASAVWYAEKDIIIIKILSAYQTALASRFNLQTFLVCKQSFGE